MLCQLGLSLRLILPENSFCWMSSLICSLSAMMSLSNRRALFAGTSPVYGEGHAHENARGSSRQNIHPP